MLAFVRRLSAVPVPDARDSPGTWQLALTAEERGRSRGRYRIATPGAGETEILVQLPRGTTLADGDWLAAATGELLQVRAKPEPTIVVRAAEPLLLLQVAYHLGNRHVPLEIRADCLLLASDPVLRRLVEQLGATAEETTAPFHPEGGAYRHAR